MDEGETTAYGTVDQLVQAGDVLIPWGHNHPVQGSMQKTVQIVEQECGKGLETLRDPGTDDADSGIQCSLLGHDAAL